MVRGGHRAREWVELWKVLLSLLLVRLLTDEATLLCATAEDRLP